MIHAAQSPGPPPPAASVVVPAHDEERTIGRLLDRLTEPTDAAPLDVVVVCNGCTDGTAAVARRYPVTVVEIEIPSKRVALRVGNEHAKGFPRVYLDADVVISGDDVRRLAEALRGPVLAAGPRRVVPRDGMPIAVRAYYDVWEALPQVGSGLFGRGVIAISRTGYERVRALPEAMADDLAISEAFAAEERVVVPEAVCVVRGPRTVADLVRRRARVITGNVQADRAELRGAESRTGPRALLGAVRRRPALVAKVPAFVAVTVVARRRARRAVWSADFDTWERDESSRQ